MRFPKCNTEMESIIHCQVRFTKWIDEIGEKKSLEWWVSIPATRNQYISKLFNIFCLIESLKEIKKKTKIEEIIVGNQELKKIIKKKIQELDQK